MKLQAESELLREEFAKAQATISRFAEKAMSRPTVTNNHQHNFGSVKITNYLSDHETYKQHTERQFVIEQASKHLEDYMLKWINGQEALANFVVDHIIKCSDTDDFILCCTDTSRKRFIYVNQLNEKVEDLMAKTFLSRISGPIKEVSHSIFHQILEGFNQQKRTTDGAFEHANIDYRIQNVTDKYLQICEFDMSDKNSDFLNELAGLLRGPKEVK